MDFYALDKSTFSFIALHRGDAGILCLTDTGVRMTEMTKTNVDS